MPELLFLGSLSLLYIPVLLSPGPNFLVLTQMTATTSRQHALLAACGMSTVSMVYATLAVTGVGLLIVQTPALQVLLRLAGGSYLLYQGLGMLRRSVDLSHSHAVQVALPRYLLQAYRTGLLTNLTNPQALVFFTSIFATLLSDRLQPWAKPASVVLVGACSITVSIGTVMVFSLPAVQQRYLQAKGWLDRMSGLLLGAFGVHLLWAVWR